MTSCTAACAALLVRNGEIIWGKAEVVVATERQRVLGDAVGAHVLTRAAAKNTTKGVPTHRVSVGNCVGKGRISRTVDLRLRIGLHLGRLRCDTGCSGGRRVGCVVAGVRTRDRYPVDGHCLRGAYVLGRKAGAGVGVSEHVAAYPVV